jgi:diguanylate cyclase (GGDEF)-like protein
MDTAIRYGGEEFLVVLPDTDQDTAVRVAEDVCIIAKDTKIHTGDGKLLPSVSVSIGVATQQTKDDSKRLIGRAEKALGKAKSSGRNQISLGE